VRTYLIEPQTVFVPYLSRVLTSAGLDIVAIGRDVDRKDINTHAPAAVFVDVDYFERGGPTAICHIRDAARKATVIAFSESEDPLFAASCVISGASAVCSKNDMEETLLRAVKDVLARIERGLE